MAHTPVSQSPEGLKIINASLFRMGTKSMSEAYKILGYRTHHALDNVMDNPWGLVERAAGEHTVYHPKLRSEHN